MIWSAFCISVRREIRCIQVTHSLFAGKNSHGNYAIIFSGGERKWIKLK